jgi:hypothetical protein
MSNGKGGKSLFGRWINGSCQGMNAEDDEGYGVAEGDVMLG